MRFVSVGCAALLLLAAGCDGTGPGCDICSTSAEISGQVTDAAGQPVPGAAVTIEVYRDSCAGEPRLGGPGQEPLSLRTDAAGEYAYRLRTPDAPFTACLVVRAAPPAGPGGEVAGVTVRFAADYPRPSRERARVDLRLPPAP